MLLRRVVPLLAVASFAGLMLVLPPLHQPQAYHDFADRRELIAGIPNTLDVSSNALFLVAALLGFLAVRRPAAFRTATERLDAAVFFAGIALTCVGSAIYHWAPSDKTLPYDRLGMTVGFMAFVAMLVHEQLPAQRWLLPVLLLIGFGSIWWWVARNDLRPYLWVQFFPVLLVLLIATIEKLRYTDERLALIAVFVAYALAKVFEVADKPVYRATREVVSGHTLKHVAAAIAPGVIALWIARRRVVPADGAVAPERARPLARLGGSDNRAEAPRRRRQRDSRRHLGRPDSRANAEEDGNLLLTHPIEIVGYLDLPFQESKPARDCLPLR